MTNNIKNTNDVVLKKDRIIAFDIIKVICVFIIFIYHYYMDVDFVHQMYDLNILKNIVIRPNMHLALIACALFLIVSGATLKLNYDGNILNFYKKRLLRILVPFYIAYFIAFCFKCINLNSTHIFDVNIPKFNFIYTLLGMDEYMMAGGIQTFTLGVGEWFLGCIMICYLLFPIIYSLDKKASFVLFIIFTAYYIFVNVYYNSFDYIMPQHFTILCQIYHFYLGIYLMDKDFLEKINIIYILLMVCIVVFSYKSLTSYDIIDNFKTTLVTTSIFLIIVKLDFCFKKSKVFKFLSELSAGISFEFFLIHHVIIYQTNIMIRFMKLNIEEVVFLIFFEFLFTIFVALIINALTNLIYNFFTNIFSCIKNIKAEKIRAIIVKYDIENKLAVKR